MTIIIIVVVFFMLAGIGQSDFLVEKVAPNENDTVNNDSWRSDNLFLDDND